MYNYQPLSLPCPPCLTTDDGDGGLKGTGVARAEGFLGKRGQALGAKERNALVKIREAGLSLSLSLPPLPLLGLPLSPSSLYF